MPDSSSDRNPVEALAEEFLERHRRGERPTVAEYAERFPQHAAEIRDLFPALLMMEDVRPGSQDATGAHVTPSVASGQRLERLGEYRILREIGRGGMGIVYEAEQESLGRHVALKVLPSHALLDARQLARFQREARAAAQLHHTNIVPVHGVGEQDGLHYYVMQFIHGLGLDQVLTELKRLRQPQPTDGTPKEPPKGLSAIALAQTMLTGRPPNAETPPAPVEPSSSTAIRLPGQPEPSALSDSGRAYWESVARIGIQVAEALAYANGQGILHRDVKPSNLLLDTQGTVWVTDLGLAKATTEAEPLTRTGDIVGTVRYLAPERFDGSGDARSDLYALGLVLYELLTLRPAFDAEDRITLIQQAMHDEPPRPRKVNARVPRDLETIVLKAIARDPAGRYQTATELADDLKRFLDDRPIQARRISETERLYRWCRRNPVTAGLLTAVAASLLLGIMVSWWFTIRLRNSLAENQRRLAQSYVDSGLHAVEDDDLLGALPWFAEALRLEQDDPIRAANHRARLSSVLWHCPRLLRLWEHGRAVNHVCFSPDGRRVLSAGDDALVRTWDVATTEEALPPLRHEAPVTWSGYSKDGTRLFTVSTDHVVRVWNAADGRPITEPLRHSDVIWHVAFSPDSQRLVTACADNQACVWDLEAKEFAPLVLRHSSRVQYAAFSPDGRHIHTIRRSFLITTGFSREIVASPHATWDARTGQRLAQSQPAMNEGPVRHELFQPQWMGHSVGGQFALLNWNRPWEGMGYGDRGASESPMGQHSSGVRFHLSPDATRFVAAGPGRKVTIVARLTHSPLGPPLQHDRQVRHAAWAPDGLLLVTACEDGSLRLWDTATRRLFKSAFQSTGPLASAADDESGPAPFAKDPAVEGAGDLLATSQDGKRLLTASKNTARIWDSKKKQPLGSPLRHQGKIHQAEFSADGRWLVTASEDETARVWDADDGQQVAALEHDARVTEARFGADGRLVATASEDHTARIWEVASGRAHCQPLRHAAPVRRVAFSPDSGRVLTVTKDWSVRLWDVERGEALGFVLRAREPGRREREYVPLVHGMTGEREPNDEPGLSVDIPRTTAQAKFSADGLQVQMIDEYRYSTAWELPSAETPGAELLLHAEVLSGHRVDAEGRLVAVERSAIQRAVRELAASPDRSAPALASRLGWHARHAEVENTWTALWHLSRLIESQPEDATLARRRAVQWASMKQWREASADLTRALEKDPRDGKTWAARGAAQLWQDEPAKALADLNRAVELLPDRKDVRLYRAVAHALAGQEEQAAGDCAAAAVGSGRELLEGGSLRMIPRDDLRAFFDRVLPSQAYERAARGSDPWAEGDAYRPLWRLHDFLNGLGDRTHRGWLVRAQALASLRLSVGKQGNMGSLGVAELYDRARSASPRDREVLNERAVAYAWLYHRPSSTDENRKQALAKALLVCTEVLEVAPDNGLIWYLRSILHQELGQLDQAVQDLDKVVQCWGEHVALWARRGLLHTESRKWDKAAADFTASLALGPSDFDVLCDLAWVHLAAGDTQRYRQACARLVRDHGTDADAWEVMRMVRLLACTAGTPLVDWAALVKKMDLLGAISHWDDDDLVTGTMLYRAGRYEEAIQRCKRFASDGLLYVRKKDLVLAMAYHQLGDVKEARKSLDSAESSTDRGAFLWWEWIELDQLADEARALIEGKKPPSK